ncbi:hypothetical protein HU675_0038615 [Bradyrhizobium septentrionale]|uniref:hypothetical protein n=1 Tax=Bradyrhizobium septentrionale TaxID=1404411 RepID=UPI00159697C6|nr:hypothetical protein [Bradyrhizobium septentrionale]UGY23800.1 hypothetical protein HU675_0038615 [Bradyrhizobium septentrionale]
MAQALTPRSRLHYEAELYTQCNRWDDIHVAIRVMWPHGGWIVWNWDLCRWDDCG